MISSVDPTRWPYSGQGGCKLLIKLRLSFVAPRQGFSRREKKRVISRSKASYAQSYPQRHRVVPVSCLRREQIVQRRGLIGRNYSPPGVMPTPP